MHVVLREHAQNVKQVVICMFFEGPCSKCEKGRYLHIVLREHVQNVKKVVICVFFEETCSKREIGGYMCVFRGNILRT